jgi:hypothetical protein
MKNYFTIIVLLLFFFVPFISSAQVITGPPCTPDIAVPWDKEQKTFLVCPYCSSKTGDKLHLKWDLKADFKEPVCSISCWNAQGDGCPKWPADKLVDKDGKPRTNLKPKDDVFIKNPFVSALATGPGTNLQVSCYEKEDSRKIKSSVGVRVVSDCTDPSVCIEKRFKDIVTDLYNSRTTIITEKNAKSWAEIDDLDVCSSESCLGSGDIRNFVSTNRSLSKSGFDNLLKVLEIGLDDFDKPLSGISLLTQAKQQVAWGGKNFENILDQNKNDIFPIGLVAFDRDTTKEEYKAVVVFGVVVKQDKSDDTLYLEVESAGGRLKLSCEKGSMVSKLSSLGVEPTFYYCSIGEIYVYPFVFLADGSNDFSRLMRELKAKGAKNTLALVSNDRNLLIPTASIIGYPSYPLDEITRVFDLQLSIPIFGTYKTELNILQPSIGLTDLMLRVVYLGNFDSLGRDCHPDGTFSKIQEQKFLAGAMRLFQNLFSGLGFLRVDKKL